MTRKMNKLSLNRETLRQLDTVSLTTQDATSLSVSVSRLVASWSSLRFGVMTRAPR